MRGKKILWISIAMMLVMAGGIGFAMAPAATKVYIDPSNLGTPNQGDTLTVEVKVDNVVGLSGWEFHLTWDPMILTILRPWDDNVNHGTWFSDDGYYWTFPSYSVSLVGGSVLVSEFMMEPEVRDGSGVLCTINFFVVGAGATDIGIESKLNDINVQPIAHQSFGSHVNVHAVTEVKTVWPEYGQLTGGINTLYATIENLGAVGTVYAWVDFMGVDRDGNIIHYESETVDVAEGATVQVSNSDFNATAMGPGRYWFDARCYWSYDGEPPAIGVTGFRGFKSKHLHFDVLEG